MEQINANVAEINVNVNVLPDDVKRKLSDITEKPQWIFWKYGPAKEGEKPDKFPCNVRTGRNAKGKHEDGKFFQNAGTLAEAEAACIKFGGEGVGFILKDGDGIVAEDLDGCLKPEADPSVPAKYLANTCSYMEVSPSDEGLRRLSKGKIPPNANSKRPTEIFEKNRWVTITGNIYGESRPLVADQEGVEWYCREFGLYSKQAPPKIDTALHPVVPIRSVLRGGTTPYGESALLDECQKILGAVCGERNNTLFAAACNIGELVAGGQVNEAQARADLESAALACAARPAPEPFPIEEIQKTINAGIEKGKRKPRGPMDDGIKILRRKAAESRNQGLSQEDAVALVKIEAARRNLADDAVPSIVEGVFKYEPGSAPEGEPLEVISTMLGVKITGIKKIGRSDATWVLVLADRTEVAIQSTTHLNNHRRVMECIQEAAQFTIPLMKAKRWHGLVTMMVEVAEEQDVPSDLDQLRLWISDYIQESRCVGRDIGDEYDEDDDEINTAFIMRSAFVRQGKLHLFTDELVKYLNIQKGVSLKHRDTTKGLRRLGFESERMTFRCKPPLGRITRSVWKTDYMTFCKSTGLV